MDLWQKWRGSILHFTIDIEDLTDGIDILHLRLLVREGIELPFYDIFEWYEHKLRFNINFLMSLRHYIMIADKLMHQTNKPWVNFIVGFKLILCVCNVLNRNGPFGKSCPCWMRCPSMLMPFAHIPSFYSFNLLVPIQMPFKQCNYTNFYHSLLQPSPTFSPRWATIPVAYFRLQITSLKITP